MTHGGTDAPCANVHVTLLSRGLRGREAAQAATAEATALVVEGLGVPAERCYVSHVDYDTDHIALGGELFK